MVKQDIGRFVAGAVLLLLWQTRAPAERLVYEGLNDAGAGANLAGLNGGTGWNGGWQTVAGSGGVVVAGSLVAGAGAPAGFDARSTGAAALVNSTSRVGRWLDCSPGGPFGTHGYLDAGGQVGADGKTVYVGFLQQPNSALKFYEFEFHRGNLDDPGRVAGIGNDLDAATVNWRAPNTTQTPLGPGSTNVNFYVVRIDFKPGNDDVYVYRNPTGATEAENEPVLTLLATADLSFDGLSLAAFLNGVTVKHDEIRLGETWADVLGNPPVFVVQPTNQAGYVGQTVTFTAQAQSPLPLHYHWQRGTNALPGQTNTSLTLSNVQLGDAGQYSVTASNALGVATSAPAALSMQIIALNLSGSRNVLVGPGTNLVLQASVGGAAPLTLQWYRDDEAVGGATNATLAPADAGVFAAGQYALVAGNSHGSVTSAVVNVFPDFGGLLAYEGFNYGQSSGDIGGAHGGFGWAGPWVNVNGATSQSYSNSLTAGANAPAGYDAHSLGGALFSANASRKGRYLNCSDSGPLALRGLLDEHGNLGADGTTIYLSFLQQPSALVQFYEFELKRGDLGDGGRMAGIGNDTGDTRAHLRIESPPGGASTFYDLGSGSTGANFYVLRIDYHAGNDTLTVYRNPTSQTEPASPTLALTNIADLSFNGISFGAYLNGVTVTHDEVRIGMTWADVIGRTVSWLQLAQRTNDASHLLLAASPNYSYQLQAATNVTGPWLGLGNVTTSAFGAARFIETNVTHWQRFYRLLNGAAAAGPSGRDIVIADFEQPTYGAWTTTGTAFGSGPASGALPNQQPVSGYQGAGLVNSYNGGDPATGTLTSPPFVITRPYLNFLIGGGNLPGQACLNLIISNGIVRTATGNDSEMLQPQQWDVRDLFGQTATLQIVDSATGGWGHINVDQIVLADDAFPSLSRTLLLTNNLLNLPVKNGAALKRVTVSVGGNPVRDFDIPLAAGAPDWWAFVDVAAFSNQTATVSVSSLAPGSTGLSAVMQTNGIVGATNLYRETLRPQLHFSSARGWLNDANGMIYAGGQYHLYYQHDPFTWDGSGQKWWGHAASPDLVHWQEMPEGIYSHAYGDDVWSGSAVVDSANTGGFKTGTNDVIVAAYYSTARGECIAYSNDGGQSFTDYPGNPVVVHAGTGRDPHLLWYAPSNYWVMAVYDDAGGNGVQFYSSPDFRHWTFRSKIYNGFFECPDLFPLAVDGDTNNVQWLLCDASSSYQLGEFDGVKFTPATPKLAGNRGAGFYASQTFTRMPPGDPRVVRMGWAIIGMPGMPFNQMMYFPTELNLRTTADGVRLCSTPVAEITNAAANVYAWTNLVLSPGYNPLAGIRGTLFDLKAQFNAGTAQTLNFTFQGVTVTYNAATQQVACNGIVNALPPVNGRVTLEIIVDRDSLEIFGNDGALYMPLPVSNPAGTGLASLTCTGGTATFNSLTVTKLKSIWPAP
ncbi:MAG TPA: immunoglobulin domain-containing protein [Verrucomicrobiae bacterium]|nr:immunoglobulin domain-containing protein [Verrucomicrobiae bacterium]